jgi:hypothetical protein
MSTLEVGVRPGVAGGVRPVAAARAAQINKRLAAFRPVLTARVRALAARHPWLADLAVSFPALLVALVVPRREVDAERVIARVIAGAPLANVAAEAGVAMWLKAFPPEAFEGPIPALPDDADFRRRIANHMPSQWRHAPRWLHAVAEAAQWGHADFAIWVARERPPPPPRNAYVRGRELAQLRRLALWAWRGAYGEAPEIAAVVNAWSAELAWDRADQLAGAWADAVWAYVDHVTPARVFVAAPVEVDGFTFEAVAGPAALQEEGEAMQHCVGGYRREMEGGRIWSVRRDGVRVATLELGELSEARPLAEIVQLRGPKNASPSVAVWRAARAWLAVFADVAFVEPTHDQRDAERTARWRSYWRPYWIAKRCVPPWLGLAVGSWDN